MAIKKRVCKSCGYFTEDKECPLCGSNSFIEKYKGKVVIFEEDSIVAEKLQIKNKGMFAMKFN